MSPGFSPVRPCPMRWNVQYTLLSEHEMHSLLQQCWSLQ
jgi:hypothetical protein